MNKPIYTPVSMFGNIVTGKTPKTSHKEYWGHDIPFITPTDIVGYDMVSCKNPERYISELGAKKQKNTLLPAGSVCVVCIGSTIGKICKTITSSITNQQINSIVPNKSFDADYLYYCFRYFLPYIQLVGGGTGAGTPIISKNKFVKLKYPVFCDKEYQKKIASILSTYDELIENNNKRIKLLEQVVENLYKEWFVRFRFPGYENLEFENGIPKGWKIKRMKEVAIIKAGGDAPTNFSKIKSDVYSVPIFSNGIDNKGLYGYTDKAKIFVPSVTISARGTIGFVCLRDEPYVPIVRLISAEPKQNIMSVYYLYLYLRTNNIEGYGTSQQQLTVPYFNKRKILVPPISIIDNFVKIVQPIFKFAKNLENSNTNLIKQRDLLLPRLVSGKLEV